MFPGQMLGVALPIIVKRVRVGTPQREAQVVVGAVFLALLVTTATKQHL